MVEKREDVGSKESSVGLSLIDESQRGAEVVRMVMIQSMVPRDVEKACIGGGMGAKSNSIPIVVV